MRSPRAFPDGLILLAGATPTRAFAADPGPLPELGLSLVRVAASLALVLALLLALAALFRRARATRRASNVGPRLETVDRMDVGARREIRLVRAGDRTLVVGITEDRMELLAELDGEIPETGTTTLETTKVRALAISS